MYYVILLRRLLNYEEENYLDNDITCFYFLIGGL